MDRPDDVYFNDTSNSYTAYLGPGPDSGSFGYTEDWGAWFYGGSMSMPTCWLACSTVVAPGNNGGFTMSGRWYPDPTGEAYYERNWTQSFTGERDTDVRTHPFELGSHIRPNESWDFDVSIGYATVDHKDDVNGVFNHSFTFTGVDPNGDYNGSTLAPSWAFNTPIPTNVGGFFWTREYEEHFQPQTLIAALGGWDSAVVSQSETSSFRIGGSLKDFYCGNGFDPCAWGVGFQYEPFSSGWWSGPTHADGGFEEKRDGNNWNIFVSPTWFWNDMHSFRLDLAYANGDGDFQGGLLGRLDYVDRFTADINGEAETTYDVDYTFTGSEIWDARSQGTWDAVSYSIEPRWYVNFDKVRFSAGVGWYYSEDEWNGQASLNKETMIMFEDNSGTNFLGAISPDPDTDAFYFHGSFTGRQYLSGETKTNTWRAPVAVEFDITEKLTARAGATYYNVTAEQRRATSQVIMENEQWEERNANNDIISVGPETFFTTDPGTSLGQPYDADDAGCSLVSTYETQYDVTTYNLGLGYYFTENLQFDLMFSGNSGYVDTNQLFGSFTIIFP
jgi:hypothetical protein